MTEQESSGTASRGQEIYDRVLDDLLGQVIRPGTRLAVDGLARHYEVSPTPVREALARLESDGLVTKHHLRGFRATDSLTREEFQHMFDVRSLLEPFAAGRAALLRSEEDLAELHRIESGMGVLEPGHERRFAMLDAKLHDVIARACGNPLIRRQLERLYAHLHLFRVRRDPIVMTGALDEHRMVVSAIERGDSLVAEAAMRSHLERSRARILATFD